MSPTHNPATPKCALPAPSGKPPEPAKDAQRSDTLAHEADQRATNAEQRAQAATDRVDRSQERARQESATLERQLVDERNRATYSRDRSRPSANSTSR
ncbi:MAG: hypothetical protein ACLP8S_14760 [Solirubrobacteraceae bacterium]